MTDEKDLQKKLTALYRRTYPDTSYGFSLGELTETELNGEHFIIGIARNKNAEYTDLGHYKPHTCSESTTFLARIKDGELTGDSICIKARAVEDHQYNPEKMFHLSNNELLKIQKGYTYIGMDKNKADKLPRTKSAQADSDIYVDGFFNVCDRSQILEALKLPVESDFLSTVNLFRRNCERVLTLTLNAEDTAEKIREDARRHTIAQEKAKKENIERTSALRDFVEKHPDNGSFISKFTRKFEARKHIRQYKQAQRAKQEQELNAKREINILRHIINDRSNDR